MERRRVKKTKERSGPRINERGVKEEKREDWTENAVIPEVGGILSPLSETQKKKSITNNRGLERSRRENPGEDLGGSRGRKKAKDSKCARAITRNAKGGGRVPAERTEVFWEESNPPRSPGGGLKKKENRPSWRTEKKNKKKQKKKKKKKKKKKENKLTKKKTAVKKGLNTGGGPLLSGRWRQSKSYNVRRATWRGTRKNQLGVLRVGQGPGHTGAGGKARPTALIGRGSGGEKTRRGGEEIDSLSFQNALGGKLWY